MGDIGPSTEETPLVHDTSVHSESKYINLRNGMKFLLVALTLLLIVGGIVHHSRKLEGHVEVQSLGLRIYTNNIRFDNHKLDVNEAPWKKRRQLITSSIDFSTNRGHANIVCLQEVLNNQLEDILYNLNNENLVDKWTYYGVGRTNGEADGEFAPILFERSHWEIMDNKTLWLSTTPDVPSVGWDAALERIVTVVTLRSKKNPGIVLNFFNTHFDHRGIKARRESALLIAKQMENFNEYPSFLCGDFNTQPTDEPYQILKGLGFKDSRVLIDQIHSYGHISTFTGFDAANEVNTIIDYIWAPYFSENANVSPSIEANEVQNYYGLNLHETHRIEIKEFGILQSNFHSTYMSDHRPVVADFQIFKSV